MDEQLCFGSLKVRSFDWRLPVVVHLAERGGAEKQLSKSLTSLSALLSWQKWDTLQAESHLY